MSTPLTPGDDPRLGELLERLPKLGVPVLPLDYARIAQVFWSGREVDWAATRELLVVLLAKDEEQRATVRHEFRRQIPYPRDDSRADANDGKGLGTKDSGLGGDVGASTEDNQPDPGPGTLTAWDRIELTWERFKSSRPRGWSDVSSRDVAYWLVLTFVLVAGLIWLTWLTWPSLPQQTVPDLTKTPPPLPAISTPPIQGSVTLPAHAMPAKPIDRFNDWVPVFEPMGLGKRLVPSLPPLALLASGLLGFAWLRKRARRLREPSCRKLPDLNEKAERVFTWSAADLKPPDLFSAPQRSDLVWGVRHFASEDSTRQLDLRATVNASAAAGHPEPRFERARYERAVWLWFDTRLRSREAAAIADQIERDLSRAGLSVQRATFAAVPDPIWFASGAHASPPDLGPDACQALVCIFTDGHGLARALTDQNGDRGILIQRSLRELRTWPHLCLVDLSPEDVDLGVLAASLGIDCIRPDEIPAWLAEYPIERTDDDQPRPAELAVRLWAAACALPRLPATIAQGRALYESLGERLGPTLEFPHLWRLPVSDWGRSTADGIRFSDDQRKTVLMAFAEWVWRDGQASEAGECLAVALDFWDRCIQDSVTSRLEQMPKESPPGTPDWWSNGRADYQQIIERQLLRLWWGDGRSAEAARKLYDIYQKHKTLAPLIRERLYELSARRIERRHEFIVLPWDWWALPEVPGEPSDTTHQRLLRMGFGSAAPSGPPALDTGTRFVLGALTGIALAGLIGLGERIPDAFRTVLSHDDAVFDGSLFRSLVMEIRQGQRIYAASRKVSAIGELSQGGDLRLHWCWTGVTADLAPAICRGLLQDPADPRRVNLMRLGKSVVLRAGSIAEPIRACAEDWPNLSVAVIAGDPWTWPEDAANNEAARQLAIRLLDSGAVDLALIGPDWAEQAGRLGEQWAFVRNSQWLFFSPLPMGDGPEARGVQAQPPDLGAHRALIRADYAALAAHLRDRVHGVLDPNDAREQPAPAVASIEILAGNPRLWGGPDVAEGASGTQFVQVCPGTFTMGSMATGPDMPEHIKPYGNELPAHPVILNGFEIARTETTWKQFGALAGSGSAGMPDGQGADWPASSVSWKDARAACGKLAPGGDLPTEAEWEYAARAGSQDPYPFPADLAGLCGYANGAGAETDWSWKNGACSDPFQEAAPVGRFPPNLLGIHDMHGNLAEWARDCTDGRGYASLTPYLTEAPLENHAGCQMRVLRGGSFYLEPRHLRSADRMRDVPERRDSRVGFRCIRRVGQQPSL